MIEDESIGLKIAESKEEAVFTRVLKQAEQRITELEEETLFQKWLKEQIDKFLISSSGSAMRVPESRDQTENQTKK